MVELPDANVIGRELRLGNVHPVASRVEDYVADAPFDVVISRAFSDLARIISTDTNMPGPNRPSPFASVARTRTFRVA